MAKIPKKLITFYVVLIGSVLTQFYFVTAYGESKLKAAHKIGGNYKINPETLPECFQSDKINLDIEQSGIYLFATLGINSEFNKDSQINDEQIQFDGKFKDNTVYLSQKDHRFSDCLNTKSLMIEATIEDKKMTGNMKVDSNSKTIPFTADLAESTPSSTPTTQH